VPVRTYAQRVVAQSELDVCCDFLTHVRGGQGPSEVERTALALGVEATRLATARHDDVGQVDTEPRPAEGAA
jgi:exonuclease SbcD